MKLLSGFPGGSAVKNLPANAGECGFNPWVQKIPWKRNGNPLQYCAWEILWTEEYGGVQTMELQVLAQLSN